MKKIPTLYVRDPETKLQYVKNEIHPDCQWVVDGEGTATYKHDGTAVMIDGEGVWQRREIKAGKPTPHTFRQEGLEDPNTGKRVGWVLADLEGDPANKWLAEAVAAESDLPDGTYELVGPKVQGNPHGYEHHLLVRHGSRTDISPVPTQFDDLAQFLHAARAMDPGFEGVVWHHPDGRMAKIKVRDFPAL